jgi:5,6-dimethylbenzimidazole synthase
MPEMISDSVVLAIHTLWLAARAAGIGIGWVSILDPERIAAILDTPPEWKLIGYLCIGYPAAEDPMPALQSQGWEQRRETSTVMFRR